MKRSDVLAKCLDNTGCGLSEKDIHALIQQTFSEEYPNKNYEDWDIPLSDNTAEHIIKTVGRAQWIKIDLFIRDLWDAY